MRCPPALPFTAFVLLAFLGTGAPVGDGALLAMAITSLSMAALACTMKGFMWCVGGSACIFCSGHDTLLAMPARLLCLASEQLQRRESNQHASFTPW